MNGDRQQIITSASNSGKITSNFEFIKTHMNNISNKTHNCADFCRDKHTVDSIEDGNKLYSKINDIINSYYSAQIKLMEKLNNESNFIVKVGEKYKELDDQLASKAGDL